MAVVWEMIERNETSLEWIDNKQQPADVLKKKKASNASLIDVLKKDKREWFKF